MEDTNRGPVQVPTFSTSLPSDVEAALRAACRDGLQSTQDLSRFEANLDTPLGCYEVLVESAENWKARRPSGPWYVTTTITPPEGSRVAAGRSSALAYDAQEIVEEVVKRVRSHYSMEMRSRAMEHLQRSFGGTRGNALPGSGTLTGRA